MNRKIYCTPEGAFSYKYLLKGPGNKSVNVLRTEGTTQPQIHTTWKNIAGGTDYPEADLYRADIGVNTIVNIATNNFSVNDVTVKITGKDIKIKLPTTSIFTSAAPGSFFHGVISCESLQFRPNELTSAYINCEDFLKLEVSKTSNKSDGKFPQEKTFLPLDEGGANVGLFSIRATICPTKSAYKTSVVISALPWPTNEFGRKLPGRVEATAYPNIHVKSMEAPHNGKNKEEHGIPMYPLIMHTDTEPLDISAPTDEENLSDRIVEAVRAFWSNAMEPVHVPVTDYYALFPNGGGEPAHDDIPCKFVFGQPEKDPADSEAAAPGAGKRTRQNEEMYPDDMD